VEQVDGNKKNVKPIRREKQETKKEGNLKKKKINEENEIREIVQN
jgi:hypothetical protein